MHSECEQMEAADALAALRGPAPAITTEVVAASDLQNGDLVLIGGHTVERIAMISSCTVIWWRGPGTEVGVTVAAEGT